jgi:hypothetical protein
MACPNKKDCALFPMFSQASFLSIWQTTYCDGDYERCARYRGSRAGDVIPDTLLPNGKQLVKKTRS